MTYEEIFQEGRAVERKQCCKDLCALCAKGLAVERYSLGDLYDVGVYRWRHPYREGHRGCWAEAIHERAYQQEQK
jgi:hypothetical protein